MTLKVLSVAFPFAPVGPDAVGGAEQVLAALDRALSLSGHGSWVLASRGSRTAGELVLADVGPRATRSGVHRAYRRAIERLTAAQHFDLLHVHAFDCQQFLPPERPRTLITLHLPSDWYDPALFLQPAGTRFNFVSEAQRSACPLPLEAAEIVENGVDLARFRPRGRPEPELVLCLGRICPEKGFDRALRAARRRGYRLLLAGRVFPYPEHELHFEREIVPLLDERRRFIGPIGGNAKRELLARASCLLVPSRAAETSSLVAMEALASGTPVVAFRVGALPSIVDDGVTGLLVSEEDELDEAIERAARLDRAACRAAAERRFDVRRMAGEYLELYRKIVDGSGSVRFHDRPEPPAFAPSA